MNQEKRGYEGPHTWAMEKKQMGLTRHSAAMDLMVEFPGDRVVPRQRFRQIPQLFMSTSSEQGAQAFVTHQEVAQQLQHVKQNRNRYRVQHNRLERTHHLEQRD